MPINFQDFARDIPPRHPPQFDTRSWPASPDEAAYHGLAGRVVRIVEPHSEADPVAILAQFLVAFGNAVGRGPHFTVEADRHGTNLFTVLVGETSKGRKGVSWRRARQIVEAADGRRAHGGDSWAACVVSGLSSGEGLIWHVRDAIEKREPIKERGRVVDYEVVPVDAGVADKRLCVFESEFASTLRVLARDGNTLSPVLRTAWDSGELRTLTKNSPARASGAHVSIVGHITRDELMRYLDRTEAGNGFANRFLWLCVRRSKLLPEGGALCEADLEPVVDDLRAALDHAATVTEVPMNDEARAIWRRVYSALSEGKPGLLGAVTARAEAQVIRLALVYALLDMAVAIGAPHLRAAIALWEFAEASACYIFGDRLGDPVADAILDALRQHPEGMTRTSIRDLFGRNQSASRIDAALATLARAGRAQCVSDHTGGRPAERWTLVV